MPVSQPASLSVERSAPTPFVLTDCCGAQNGRGGVDCGRGGGGRGAGGGDDCEVNQTVTPLPRLQYRRYYISPLVIQNAPRTYR
jgi:hypothetical protein